MAVATALPVELDAGADTLAFYTSAACDVAVERVAVAVGESRVAVYLRDTVAAGAVWVRAASAGLAEALASVAVSPGPAARLVFAATRVSVAVGACSEPVTLHVEDAYANRSGFAAATFVNLVLEPAGGEIYAGDDVDCSGLSLLLLASKL